MLGRASSPLATLGGLVAAIVREANWVVICLVAIYGCVAFPVALGLRQRRYWAWRGNWIILAFLALRAASSREPAVQILGLAWVFVNGRYFFKRRAMFNPPPKAGAESA